MEYYTILKNEGTRHNVTAWMNLEDTRLRSAGPKWVHCKKINILSKHSERMTGFGDDVVNFEPKYSLVNFGSLRTDVTTSFCISWREASYSHGPENTERHCPAGPDLGVSAGRHTPRHFYTKPLNFAFSSASAQHFPPEKVTGCLSPHVAYSAILSLPIQNGTKPGPANGPARAGTQKLPAPAPSGMRPRPKISSHSRISQTSADVRQERGSTLQDLNRPAGAQAKVKSEGLQQKPTCWPKSRGRNVQGSSRDLMPQRFLNTYQSLPEVSKVVMTQSTQRETLPATGRGQAQARQFSDLNKISRFTGQLLMAKQIE